MKNSRERNQLPSLHFNIGVMIPQQNECEKGLAMHLASKWKL